MSEENQGATEAQNNQQFQINRVYTKDISFETPNSPAIFAEKWEPQVKVDLNTQATAIADNVYEVVLMLTVEAKLGDKSAYLAEVKQAGIFSLSGFSEQEMGPMLHSFCPNILFPYAREVISDLVAKGSFPQLLLAPINFDAVYAQGVEKMRKQQEMASEGSEVAH